eukprot:scaffold15125_cov171-Skeletonema_marinoi.AAC.1
MAARELVFCGWRSAPHDCFFWKRKKVDYRIWPEQQKSPTSTSSNFNLLHQTLQTLAPSKTHHKYQISRKKQRHHRAQSTSS